MLAGPSLMPTFCSLHLALGPLHLLFVCLECSFPRYPMVHFIVQLCAHMPLLMDGCCRPLGKRSQPHSTMPPGSILTSYLYLEVTGSCRSLLGHCLLPIKHQLHKDKVLVDFVHSSLPSQYPAQYLGHSRCSVKICCKNDE